MASSRLLLVLLLCAVVSVNCQRRKFGRKLGPSPQVGTAPKPVSSVPSVGRRLFPGRRGQTSTRGTGQRGSALSPKPSRTFGSSPRTPSKPAPGRKSSRRNPTRGSLTTAKPLRVGSVRGRGQTRPSSKVRGSSLSASRGRQGKSKPAVVGGRKVPPRFGGGRSTSTGRAGGRSTSASRTGGRNTSASRAGGRSTSSSRAGGRSKPTSFGGARGKPTSFGGARGKSPSVGGRRGKSSSFGGARGKSPSVGGRRGKATSFGGARGKSTNFGRGKDKKQNSFGRGQARVRGSSSQNPRTKVQRPNTVGLGGTRRTQNTNNQRKPSKPKVDFNCPDKNGTYPHKKACDKYYWCVNGEAREESCPDGLYFHPDKVYPCVYPIETECTESSEEAQPTEQCPRQFAKFRDTSSRNSNSDCGSFTNCVSGVAFESQCPQGLAFDSTTLTCEWADLVEECSDVAGFLGFNCPKRDFTAEEVGEFTREPHPQNCTFFYLCLNAESGDVVPRLQGCPDSMVFNSETKECTDQVDEAAGCGEAIDKNVLAAFRQREQDEQERREERLAKLRARFFS